MRFRYIISKFVGILLVISLSACSSGATLEAPTAAPAPTQEMPAATTAPTSGQAEKDFEDFDPGNFDQSATIDNKWFPLKPGTQFIYEGETIENGKNVPHKIIITVTDLTKVIGGVRAVATWDRDFSADALVEAELAFFAQDNDGNVWRMGEYPEEYEAGKFVTAPTWIHGFEDARAGIAMFANPQAGMPSYSQGWGPAVGWTDRGQIELAGQETCVPVTCYKDVLVIAETSKSEQGAFQLKFFAPGVGNIRTDWKGADVTQETLELTQLNQLSPAEMAEVRAQAIELEKHAYEVSSMYTQTFPVEYPVGTPALTVPVAAVNTPTPQASMPSGSFEEEILVYASDLPQSALFELDFIDNPASPGGKLIGLPNNGDELDPPPENDPHVTFTAQVHNGRPYRCWIHMKVGAPKGKSQANVIWAQFSGAVDQTNAEVFKPGSSSYMTAKGPEEEGWAWVGCELAGTDSLVYFQSSGEITIRLQAGMEGVGFDQFVLSPTDFLQGPPTEFIVEK